MSPEQVRARNWMREVTFFSSGLCCTKGGPSAPIPRDTSGVILPRIWSRVPTSATRVNPDVPLMLESVISKALDKTATSLSARFDSGRLETVERVTLNPVTH